jgi:hypothetical protein
MPTANEYRAMADECLKTARESNSEDERRLYFTLAQTWLEVATLKDKDVVVQHLPHLPPAPRLRVGRGD